MNDTDRIAFVIKAFVRNLSNLTSMEDTGLRKNIIVAAAKTEIELIVEKAHRKNEDRKHGDQASK